MKRLIITALLSIAAAGHALAADLPRSPPPRAAVVYVAPVYNWAGIYVGVNGGYGWGSAKWNAGPAGGAGGFPALSNTLNDHGGFAGGTLGVNFQSGAFVYGAEGDFDWSGVNTGSTALICQTTGTCQTGSNWLGTFRARAGFAADRVLFYGTGGGAVGNIQTTFNGVQTSTTQFGWTVGAGVEAAFAENWTAKVEYLYVDLGTLNGNCGTATCTTITGGPVVPFSINLTESLIRAGVNYKFNW
ncbi:MAG TPA: outer membrane protein [Xanthobacteraceae bacterium]|nr:outer membrane protein [Xanthobacteraceae bacterium]